MTTDLIVSVIVIGSDSFHQLSQGTLVLRVDLCEGYGDARLPVDQASRPGLALDDAVGSPHLAAQGRQEDHELDGTHIVSDCHQLSLHPGGDSVDPCSKDRWPLGGDVACAGGFLLSSGKQALLLLSLCLWPVPAGQHKQLFVGPGPG